MLSSVSLTTLQHHNTTKLILLMLVEFGTGNNNQDLHVHTRDGNQTGRKKELPQGHVAKNASMKGFQDLY